MPSDRYDCLLIYCNSLSFAGPWQKLYPGKVWELSLLYEKIFRQLGQEPTIVLTAEEKLKADLCQLAEAQPYPLNLEVLDRLDWVRDLEKLSPIEQVQVIQKYIDQFARHGYQKLVFACTHFEREGLEKQPDIKIIQPGLAMLKKFISKFLSGELGTSE